MRPQAITFLPQFWNGVVPLGTRSGGGSWPNWKSRFLSSIVVLLSLFGETLIAEEFLFVFRIGTNAEFVPERESIPFAIPNP
jgi:hypothetical protein